VLAFASTTTINAVSRATSLSFPDGQLHFCPFPASEVAARREGNVIVSFLVKSDGTVKNVHLAKSSGNMVFDATAVRCVSNWRYGPEIRNGKKIQAKRQTEIQFRLR